jgi:adenosine kinase
VNTELLHIIPGEYTASFFATTDRNSAQIASFYPGAMAKASIQSIKDLPLRPDLVVVSPNDPGAMMKFAAECRETGIEYLYDPSQQVLRLDGKELARDLEGAKFLFCNDYEFELICKKTGFERKDILRKVEILVVTQGKSGAMLFTGNEEYYIPTVPEEVMIDPTGVGDAFRAGFLVGYSKGFDWILCGQIGALAAVYCLEKNGPQEHAFKPLEFVMKFRKHFDDNGKLEVLLSETNSRRVS